MANAEKTASDVETCQIHITGIVQGVGFRPFVYELATRYTLNGWVLNNSSGVDIEVTGPSPTLEAFITALQTETPPLAVIDSFHTTCTESKTEDPRPGTFTIRHSEIQADAFVPISPDVCICEDCLQELFDPTDRRYRYPFINCTNCGPRFTIIRDIPYDRPMTTMADFPLCPDCQHEYEYPLDRRFHAQPNACTRCGPQVEFTLTPRPPLSKGEGEQYHRCELEGQKLEIDGDSTPSQPPPARGRGLSQGGLRGAESLPTFNPKSLSSHLWEQYPPTRGVFSSPSLREGVRGREQFLQNLHNTQAIEHTQAVLTHGGIVALKGLGGFHLACDATNDEALQTLRRRKGRVDKPFAVMAVDIATVETFAEVDAQERQLLTSKERPIVLLKKKANNPLSQLVAPGNQYIGVMLPYTPLHYLLLTFDPQSKIPNPKSKIVLTSGNFSEEPIVKDNAEALTKLAPLADAFLLHNRDIHVHCDDSVVRVFQGHELPIRRSRGYAPFPVKLPFQVEQILAVGGELKNTFCLTKDNYAFMSQHIGDMENLETLQAFEESVAHFLELFRVEPSVIAYDMHPGYLSTKWAREGVDSKFASSKATSRKVTNRKSPISNPQSQSPIPNPQSPLPNLQSPIPSAQSKIQNPKSKIKVQHHHAHIASVMAEHGLDSTETVLGFSFDGTGYGPDGAIWGGELLVANYRTFSRVAHLKYIPLPGGDAAIKRPYRTALAHLWAAGVTWDKVLPPVAACSTVEQGIIKRQLETSLNCVPTSSMGRLFDAVATLAGGRQTVTYEAQAAIEFEAMMAANVDERYQFGLPPHISFKQDDSPIEIEAGPVIQAVVADVLAGVLGSMISAKFHNAVADLVRQLSMWLREQKGINKVALSGGVFQNVTLLELAVAQLNQVDFEVLTHQQVPPNDGGLALGQAIIANFKGR